MDDRDVAIAVGPDPTAEDGLRATPITPRAWPSAYHTSIRLGRCALSAQTGDFVARHFVGRGWRVFRRRAASTFCVVAPGAAFLPRGL